MRFRKISIIGVGLLGGSLGLAIRRRRLTNEVAGFVRRASSLKECRQAGAADIVTRNLEEAIAGADLVILCTPLAQMKSLAARMIPALRPGAVVTDVGSVKASVVRDLEGMFRRAGAHFVGSHPMAGAERTGVRAARADLFLNAVCVVTPSARSDKKAVAAVEKFWKSIGARVLRLSPDVHDTLVSRSSHLPHLAAAALANLVLDPALPKQQPMLCANGFRDTTRIASGSPEMWRDIALANRKNLDRALGTFAKELQKLRTALKTGNESAIMRFLERAKHRRDTWCAGGASPSSE